MVLPREISHGESAAPTFEVIRGSAVFTNTVSQADFDIVTHESYVRSVEIREVLDQIDPVELLQVVMKKLKLTESLDASIAAQKIIDRASQLHTAGSSIDQAVDPNHDAMRVIEDENEYEVFRFERLDEMYIDKTVHDIDVVQAASAYWYAAETLEDNGYTPETVPLLKAVYELHNNADSMYLDTTRTALALARISVALEKGLL